MGRLDDLYQELQGNKAKSSSSSAGAAGAFGVETVVTAPRSKPAATDASPAFEPQDLGTKKDPAKLRKQVIASREEGDVIARLLKDPVEGVDSKSAKRSAGAKGEMHSVAQSEAHASAAASGSSGNSLHDRAKFATGAGFNQKKFTRRLNRYVVDSRMTHISKEDLGKFVDSVAKHARAVSSGNGLDRAARMRIKADLTGQWKSGGISRTSMQGLKDMLGKL